MVGNVSEKAEDLCRITKHSLDEAIKICGPGVPVREVGKVRITAAASNVERFSLFKCRTINNQSLWTCMLLADDTASRLKLLVYRCLPAWMCIHIHPVHDMHGLSMSIFKLHLLSMTGAKTQCVLQVIHAIADQYKLGVVREFVGHGVGQHFHSMPTVPHCRNTEKSVMIPGQTFTIEPMLTERGVKGKMWKDNWTVVTTDGGLSAQYEHTILITDNGHEILTLP